MTFPRSSPTWRARASAASQQFRYAIPSVGGRRYATSWSRLDLWKLVAWKLCAGTLHTLGKHSGMQSRVHLPTGLRKAAFQCYSARCNTVVVGMSKWCRCGLTARVHVTVQLTIVVAENGSPHRHLVKLCTIESGSSMGKTHLVRALRELLREASESAMQKSDWLPWRMIHEALCAEGKSRVLSLMRCQRCQAICVVQWWCKVVLTNG